jgi:solute carrier family 25 protein 16
MLTSLRNSLLCPIKGIEHQADCSSLDLFQVSCLFGDQYVRLTKPVFVSGVASVFFTYPLELIRVRLAYQTKLTERTSLREVIRVIYQEGHEPPIRIADASKPATTVPRKELLSSRIPIVKNFVPFYRGFSVTLIGMVPYAGVSFLTYGTLKRHISDYIPMMADHKTISDLTCGAVAGAVSQTASYPFEVIRRRMQVGGVKGGTGSLSWKDAVVRIWAEGKGKVGRGFYTGITIGWLKVVPMTR